MSTLTAGRIITSNVMQFATYTSSASYPANPQRGMVIFDTTELALKVYTGSATDTPPGSGWVSVGSSGIAAIDRLKHIGYGVQGAYTSSGAAANISQSTTGYLGGKVLEASITPKSASNKLLVQAMIPWMGENPNTSDHFTFGLYRDSSSSAIATWYANDRYQDNYDTGALNTNGINHQCWLKLNCVVTAGSTQPTTFSLYGGCNGGTVVINGAGNASFPGLNTAFKIQSHILIFEMEET